MGRPRKFNADAPKHIDQLKLPVGVYWDASKRIWYTKLKDGAKARSKRIANANATLADLHRVMLELASASIEGKGTIKWLHAQFEESEAWRELKPPTQKDYRACLRCLARTPTRIGITCDLLLVDKIRRADMQLLVDKIAKTTPAMANHVKRYLGRLFAWGMQRDHMTERANPAHGLDAANEVGAFKMPEPAVMARVIDFARARGARQARTAGSCPPYLWIVMVLAYRCRLRGVEVLTLTDANHRKDGIRTNRRKGSLDNTVAWSSELIDAWAAAVALRKAAWERTRRSTPIKASDRPLIVNEGGESLAQMNAAGEFVDRTGMDSAWQRFMALAIKEKVIAKSERFTLHGLKHRGITDSADKKSGGHVAPSMVVKYDHAVPLVAPAGLEKSADFSPDFSPTPISEHKTGA